MVQLHASRVVSLLNSPVTLLLQSSILFKVLRFVVVYFFKAPVTLVYSDKKETINTDDV